MKSIYHLLSILIIWLNISCNVAPKNNYVVPAEFEEQEYIWLSWIETGFLQGDPFYKTIVDAIKEIHTFVKVKIFYSEQLDYDKLQMKQRIVDVLLINKIDTSKIEWFYNEKKFGAIQDPGPIFIRKEDGLLAVADFRYAHPDERSEKIDVNAADQLNLPIISSPMYSEGGAWQTNGKGTMLLVESVELDRNKTMSKEQIEAEYKRVLGIKKIIWLKNGAKEEEWGLLANGVYGIGTGGHIDEFCRFVDPNTVLLTEIYAADTIGNEISKESFRRMEHNFQILNQSTTVDGKPIKIIRLPAGPIMTRKIQFSALTKEEQSWFDGVSSDSVEFFLTTGYMNFIIANNVIVTAKFWKEGLPESIKIRDLEAKLILEKAFPNRKVVQIDCLPLHHDGAGLHCHSRNQPKA